MTVLVVGATGTVGRPLVQQLADAGEPVRAMTRDPARAGSLPDGVDVVRADLEDPATWAAALDGVDRVFLLRPPQVARAARLAPFLAAAATAGVQHVVVLSVQGAGRNPLLPHRALERAVERSGMAWTHLRPGWFLQNLLTVHREEVRDRSEVFVPAGRGRTAVVDARDVAAAAVLALTRPGHRSRAYTLTSEAVDYAQVAQALTEVLGRTVHYPRPGAVRYALTELRRGRPAPLVLVTVVLYSATRLRLASGVSGDLAAVLGRPPTDLRTFVADHADQWRPEGGTPV